MYKEMYARHADFLAACVGHGFEMPPPDVFRVNFLGEIESAVNFEYDDLYIQWFVDLPTGWVSNGPQQLSGVTHTCRTRTEGRAEVAYFSYPFSFDLLYIGCVLNKDQDALPRWPLLYLEVLSLDSWHRYRTEGYGYLTFPQSPGYNFATVSCWRPAGKSLFSEMRRFFIGGSPELEDPTYTAIPSAFEGSHLSRYGFTSISTGSVNIKTHTIFQSQAFLHSQSQHKKMASVVERIGFSSTQANIQNVLEAFQRAKQRMIAARENLKSDFIKTLGELVVGDTDA
jgi:Meckel syndrome type 1 protein